MASYYTLLTVSPHASVADIKSKYRQLSLRYHPDSGGSTEKMVELNEAYHTLSNPLLRREYDQRLSPAKPSATYAYSAPSSSYYPPQQPTYRPTPTTRPDYTSPPGYTRRRQDEYVKEKSSFWSWFGVLASHIPPTYVIYVHTYNYIIYSHNDISNAYIKLNGN
jgi:curved DNA-binding protein CbpA